MRPRVENVFTAIQKHVISLSLSVTGAASVTGFSTYGSSSSSSSLEFRGSMLSTRPSVEGRFSTISAVSQKVSREPSEGRGAYPLLRWMCRAIDGCKKAATMRPCQSEGNVSSSASGGCGECHKGCQAKNAIGNGQTVARRRLLLRERADTTTVSAHTRKKMANGRESRGITAKEGEENGERRHFRRAMRANEGLTGWAG